MSANKIHILPVFSERPSNPARTDMQTGEIEINARRFYSMPQDTQSFVLLHEQGHWNLHTFDELAADRYALERLALKKPYSLINYVKAVEDVSYGDRERVSAAQRDTLHIAARNGSKQAEQLLKRYASADGEAELTDSNRWIWMVVLLLALCVPLLIAEIKGW